MKILIEVDDLKISAYLNESNTASLIAKSLPIEGRVNLWGEEIYFSIPVKAALEEDYARDVVEIGDLGYWPDGSCFCIFFGKTPISTDDEIRPASTVTLIGKVEGDINALKKVKNGAVIKIKKVE